MKFEHCNHLGDLELKKKEKDMGEYIDYEEID